MERGPGGSTPIHTKRTNARVAAERRRRGAARRWARGAGSVVDSYIYIIDTHTRRSELLYIYILCFRVKTKKIKKNFLKRYKKTAWYFFEGRRSLRGAPRKTFKHQVIGGLSPILPGKLHDVDPRGPLSIQAMLHDHLYSGIWTSDI